MARFLVVVSLTLLLQIGLMQGQIPTVSDPQALTLAAQSIAALSKGTTVSDVKLIANVTSSVGSDYLSGRGRPPDFHQLAFYVFFLWT